MEFGISYFMLFSDPLEADSCIGYSLSVVYAYLRVII